MSRVVVTGVSGVLGSRLVRLLDADDRVDRIVGIDIVEPVGAPAKLEVHRADLVTADLKPILDGADVVVHLVAGSPERSADDGARLTVEATRRVLDAAGDASRIVLLSTAAVYGAWENNPVPLTEDAPLRPNGDVAWAVQRAEAERLLSEWRWDHPAATTVVLRPTVTVCPDEAGWLARTLRRARTLAGAEADAPAQFLHVDDLAAAVASAAFGEEHGVFNVAPDGWLDADALRSLAAGTPGLPLTARVAARLARIGLGGVPAGWIPYATQPWVVANDRLRATGWSPDNTNDEAFVAGFEAAKWDTVTPQRRQELALAVAGLGIAGVVTGVLLLVRRARRGR